MLDFQQSEISEVFFLHGPDSPQKNEMLKNKQIAQVHQLVCN